MHIRGEFDVAVPGFGPSRLNAQHHHFAVLGRAKRGPQQPFILVGFPDHVVGGKDSHDRVGVDGLEDMRGQTDGRRRVAGGGFGQNLALGDFGKLVDDLGAQVVVGQNPNPVGRKHGPQAVHGLLNQ